MATASVVRVALDNAIRDASVEVVVDLSDVQFFDAMTVGMFDRANLRLNQSGRRLTLSGMSPLQEKVLRILGLDHLLAVAVCRSGFRASGASSPRS